MDAKPLLNGRKGEGSLGVDTLVDLLYKELKRVAGAKFRMERADHTLQPTAVVHEAYLRPKRREKRWESETEFRKYAAPVIRHVLVDHARSRASATRVTLSSREDIKPANDHATDMDVLAFTKSWSVLRSMTPDSRRSLSCITSAV